MPTISLRRVIVKNGNYTKELGELLRWHRNDYTKEGNYKDDIGMEVKGILNKLA